MVFTGRLVLILLPTSSSRLLAKLQGPLEVTWLVGLTMRKSKRIEIVHGRYASSILNYTERSLWLWWQPFQRVRNEWGGSNMGGLIHPDSLCRPPPNQLFQITEAAKLYTEFSDIFSLPPDHTNLIQHQTVMPPGVVVCSCTCRLHKHKEQLLQEELTAMCNIGVIKKPHSDWSIPVVWLPE